jgi:hypothetical protein
LTPAKPIAYTIAPIHAAKAFLRRFPKDVILTTSIVRQNYHREEERGMVHLPLMYILCEYELMRLDFVVKSH